MVCTHALYNEVWAGSLDLSVAELPEAMKHKRRKASKSREHRKNLSPGGLRSQIGVYAAGGQRGPPPQMRTWCCGTGSGNQLWKIGRRGGDMVKRMSAAP